MFYTVFCLLKILGGVFHRHDATAHELNVMDLKMEAIAKQGNYQALIKVNEMSINIKTGTQTAQVKNTTL